MYGVCKICGCTDDNPCFNPICGTCWWVDDSHTLCSHCADAVIAMDPETKHCINSAASEVPEDAECCTCAYFNCGDFGEICMLTGEETMCCSKACAEYSEE